MVEAQINELFEEAIGRCEELSDEARSARDAVESVVDHAEELADRFTSEADEARRAMEEVSSLLDRAEDTVAAAVEQATGGFDGLAARAAEVQSTAGGAVDRVKEALEELSRLREELQVRLENQGREATDDVTRLSEQVAALQEEIAERLRSAAGKVQELTTAVGQAERGWAEARKALVDAMDELESGAETAMAAYSKEIEDVLNHERVDVLVQRLANELLIGSHNEAVDLLGRTFEQEVPAALVQPLDAAKAAVQSLTDLAGQQGALLEQRIEEVGDGAEASGEALERMSPALDLVQQVG